METPSHTEIAETFVRFYVLLSQYLDRCQDETLRQSMSDQEFQNHLESTREKLLEGISTNHVVKEKMMREYQRIQALCASFSRGDLDHTSMAEFQHEREILKVKTLALSDLVAVFRSA